MILILVWLNVMHLRSLKSKYIQHVQKFCLFWLLWGRRIKVKVWIHFEHNKSMEKKCMFPSPLLVVSVRLIYMKIYFKHGSELCTSNSLKNKTKLFCLHEFYILNKIHNAIVHIIRIRNALQVLKHITNYKTKEVVS